MYSGYYGITGGIFSSWFFKYNLISSSKINIASILIKFVHSRSGEDTETDSKISAISMLGFDDLSLGKHFYTILGGNLSEMYPKKEGLSILISFNTSISTTRSAYLIYSFFKTFNNKTATILSFTKFSKFSLNLDSF